MRESTSWNQANGSTPHRLQEAMKLRNIAAVLPPPSLPKKCPVAAAQCDIAVGPFGGAVVNLQLAVLQKARERLPLIQRIAHRGAGRTLRQALPVAAPADTGGACRAAVPIPAGAMPTFAPPTATAPWRAPPLDTGARSVQRRPHV
jgi:hypothetical protein